MRVAKIMVRTRRPTPSRKLRKQKLNSVKTEKILTLMRIMMAMMKIM